MLKFLQRLLVGNDEALIKFLRDELKMLRDQLTAKDRQIEQLQAQVGSVLSYQYDRPKITKEEVPAQLGLPADTLSDVNSDQEFVEQMQQQVYQA